MELCTSFVLLNLWLCWFPVCLAGLHITASEGQTVWLPCELEPRSNLSTLIWMLQNKDVLRVTGEKSVERINSRAETFLDQHGSGNLSIKITNVSKSDAGRYECHLRPQGSQSNVELRVTNRTTAENTSNDHVKGGTVAPLTCALVLVLTFLCICFGY